MRKTLWTLNVGNYAPEICAITYPLLKGYAEKIGAEFRVITERRFPDFPVVYEKLQIRELGRDSDWNVYIDSDALIHPDLYDVTEVLPRDTVAHWGSDFAPRRWRYDEYFRRDGRHIASCNWFTVASNWCLDLWTPLDIPLEEAIGNTQTTLLERQCSAAIEPRHLIDDYTLSRNIARFGLKFDTFAAINERRRDKAPYWWHAHLLDEAQKLERIKNGFSGWGLDIPNDVHQAEARNWIP